MSFREFIVPLESDFEAVLGVTLARRGEDWVRGFAITGADGFEIDLTVDVPGRSATIIVRHDASEIVRIEREGATQLRLAPATPQITITFETDDTTGQLQVTLTPAIHVSEIVLFA